MKKYHTSNMNEAQLNYICGNQRDTLGTIICIQSRKYKPHTTLIFLDQITAKLAFIERHDARSSKDMINEFITKIFTYLQSNDREHYYRAHKNKILYVPKGIISSPRYVESLESLLDVKVREFNWKSKEIPKVVIDLHMVITTKSFPGETNLRITNFNKLLEVKMRRLGTPKNNHQDDTNQESIKTEYISSEQLEAESL